MKVNSRFFLVTFFSLSMIFLSQCSGGASSQSPQLNAPPTNQTSQAAPATPTDTSKNVQLTGSGTKKHPYTGINSVSQLQVGKYNYLDGFKVCSVGTSYPPNQKYLAKIVSPQFKQMYLSSLDAKKHEFVNVVGPSDTCSSDFKTNNITLVFPYNFVKNLNIKEGMHVTGTTLRPYKDHRWDRFIVIGKAATNDTSQKSIKYVKFSS